MAVMAIGANGGADLPARNGPGMGALLIGQEGTVADAGSFHHRFIAVTGAAGLGDIYPVDG